jgi:hypothetical protein
LVWPCFGAPGFIPAKGASWLPGWGIPVAVDSSEKSFTTKGGQSVKPIENRGGEGVPVETPDPADELHTNGRLSAVPRLQLDYKTFSELHKFMRAAPVQKTGLSRFAGYLALYLPDVAALITEDDFGILHMEVNAITRATRQAIENSDWNTVRTHFAFVNDLFERTGAGLRDAISVSYLSNLLQDELTPKDIQARNLLPTALAAELERIERHFVQIETQAGPSPATA